MSEAWKTRISFGAILIAVVVLAAGCTGGSTPSPHFNDTSGTPGLQGNVTNPGDNPVGNPVVTKPAPVGTYPGAPLGTDPAYETTPISELITTTKISNGVSSVRSTSSEDPVLWVAVAPDGEEPIPGTDSPPLYEGSKIDLYIRYQVFPGELTISREWKIDEMGLDYIEPSVTHPEAGTYQAMFPFVLAYGMAGTTATFTGAIGPAKSSSIVVIITEPGQRDVIFNVEELPVLPPIHYPSPNPDDFNDTGIHGKGCLPENITVNWNDTDGYHSEIDVSCDKMLSNLVIKYSDGSTKKVNLGGLGLYEGTWGYNNGLEIVGVWVHSGCNDSGDGPAYGEYFTGYDITRQNKMAMAQFAWDDDQSPDRDYNDFIGRMNIAETRTAEGGPYPANSLVQIQITAKALARGSSNVADWQFNVGASFPSAQDVYVMVNRYHADGTEAYYQELLHSVGGASFAVFSPTAAAFPGTTGWNTVNCEAGSTYVDGDYAEVIMIVTPPQAQGSYTPMPYDPELAVTYEAGGPVSYIPLWSTPADFDDGDPLTTLYPPAFIIPDTYAWAYEEESIENIYPEFTDWIAWMNNQSLTQPSPPWWQYDPVKGTHYFYRQDFN